MTNDNNLLNNAIYTREYFHQEDICRLCWSKDANNELFSRMIFCTLKSPLFFKVQSCLNIDLSEDDSEHHPRKICEKCFLKIEQFNDFKVFCQNSNKKLNAILNGTNSSESKFDFESKDIKDPIKIEKCEDNVIDVIDLIDAESLDSFPDNTQSFETDVDFEIESGKETSEISNVKNIGESSIPIVPPVKQSHQKINVKPQKPVRESSQKPDNTGKQFLCTSKKNLENVGELSLTTKSKPEWNYEVTTSNISSRRYERPSTYCNTCYIDLKDKEAYLKHKSEMHGIERDGKFRCFGCSKLFDHRKTRMTHELYSCKSLEFGFKCGICSSKLPTRGSYEKHLNRHRLNKIDYLPDESFGIFQCDKCDERFIRRSEWCRHKLKHRHMAKLKREGWKDDIPETTTTISNQKQKKLPYVRSATYCNTCFIDLKDEEAYLNHNSEAHGIGRDGKYKCFGCGKLFNHRKARLQHEGYFCSGLEYGFKCNICGRYLPLRGSYEKHLNHHRLNKTMYSPDDSGGIFKCEKCDIRFTRRSEWYSHLLKHRQNEKKGYICETCGKEFSRQTYLNVHVAIHSGTKRYKCDICGYRSIQKSNITIHMRKHTNERPYACDLCPQKCVSASNLLAHRRRHLGIRKYQCSYCKKLFGYKETLNDHISIKHQRSQQNTCQVCGSEYALRSGLRRHLRKKHPELIQKPKTNSDSNLLDEQNTSEIYPNQDGDVNGQQVLYPNNVQDKNTQVLYPNNDTDENGQALYSNIDSDVGKDYELQKTLNIPKSLNNEDKSLQPLQGHEVFDVKIGENDKFVCFEKRFETTEGENMVIVLQEQE